MRAADIAKGATKYDIYFSAYDILDTKQFGPDAEISETLTKFLKPPQSGMYIPGYDITSNFKTEICCMKD